MHSRYLAHCTFQRNPLTCIIRRMFIQTSSVFFLLETSTSVTSSLKTLLVLVYRRIFRPSHVHLLGGATVSRPHHCQHNSLWAAAWATTMLCHVVEQMTGPSAFDFVVPVHPSRCSSTCSIQSIRIFLWLLSSAKLAVLFCNILIPFCLERLWQLRHPRSRCHQLSTVYNTYLCVF